MNKYLVGGAVRDTLLGKTPKDLDWVVVGSSVPEMLDKGYEQVGKDFPVFIDGAGHEIALARIERKVGDGHDGFECDANSDITLEEDLLRRDLTINAMAMDSKGNVIDPFGGKEDLKGGILRHVSSAFEEDPLRVLRVARFAARLGFDVHYSTRLLMTEMVERGDLDHLTPERVWSEIERALTEFDPMAFFWILDDVGALAKIFPYDPLRYSILNSDAHKDPCITFASFFRNIKGEGAVLVNEVCRTLKIPNRFKKAALNVANWSDLFDSKTPHPEMIVELFKRGFLNNDKEFEELIMTLAHVRSFRNVKVLRRVRDKLKGLDMAAVTNGSENPKQAVFDAMLNTVKKMMKRDQ